MLRFGDEAWNYAELDAEANAFSAVFRQAGIGREPVAVMMENGPALLLAQVAAAKIGAVAALISPDLSGARLSQVLRSSGARHVFADAACLGRAAAPPESASLTLWGQGDPALLPPQVEPLDAALAAASRGAPPSPPVAWTDPFLIIYGSGTTGAPRPGVVSHGCFALAGRVLASVLALDRSAVLYSPLPLSHGMGAFVGWAATLAAGATLATRRRFRAEAFLADVQNYGASHFLYGGEMCGRLLRLPATDDDRRHRLRVGIGAGMRADVWARFQERFAIDRLIEVYGQNESSLGMLNLEGRVGSVGRPLLGQRRRVALVRCDLATGALQRDATGLARRCRPGEVGELLYRVRGTAGATSRRREPSAPIAHDVIRLGDVYRRTGDLLRQDGDGRYYFVDRLVDAFASDGIDLFPHSIAGVLHAVPGIAEANVYDVADPVSGRRVPMAAVVLEPRVAFDAAAFGAHTEVLPPAARPVFVRLVAAMDATGDLKLRKTELRGQGYDQRRVTDPVWVRAAGRAAYVPLTDEVRAALQGGRWSF